MAAKGRPSRGDDVGPYTTPSIEFDDDDGENWRHAMSTQTGDPALPLLDAMLNLTAFHREHEKFYPSSPREQAVALQRHSRALHALADRWIVTHTVRGWMTRPRPSIRL